MTQSLREKRRRVLGVARTRFINCALRGAKNCDCLDTIETVLDALEKLEGEKR